MFNYDNKVKPRIKRNPCKKGYWKSIPSIQKAFVNRLLINNTVGPSEAKQHKGENHRDQAGETFQQTASKRADRPNLTSLEKEPKKKGGNKPSRKCQALLVMQLRPRSRQGKNFPKLEKDAKKKPHKEKTKGRLQQEERNRKKEGPYKKLPSLWL